MTCMSLTVGTQILECVKMKLPGCVTHKFIIWCLPYICTSPIYVASSQVISMFEELQHTGRSRVKVGIRLTGCIYICRWHHVVKHITKDHM